MRPPWDCGPARHAAPVCVAGARSGGEDRAVGGERHNAKIENGKRHAGNEALGVNTDGEGGGVAREHAEQGEFVPSEPRGFAGARAREEAQAYRLERAPWVLEGGRGVDIRPPAAKCIRRGAFASVADLEAAIRSLP